MKKIFILFFLCGMVSVAFSQTKTKSEKIRELLELTGSGELGIQVMQTLIPAYEKNFPNVEKEFWKQLSNEINAEELVSLVIPIYDKYYSESDVDQLIAFYKTPLGAKLIKTMQPIMQESMLAGQKWGKELGEKIALRLKDRGYL
jgi:hypothetical protein